MPFVHSESLTALKSINLMFEMNLSAKMMNMSK